jgi:2-C-methyl-D-erythritol 4-phosphate cytidylyltransferase
VTSASSSAVTRTGKSRCFALIPAAGVGTRAGQATPKQYLPIAGVPMIVHTLRAFMRVAAIESVAVVVAPDDRLFETIALDAGDAARITTIHAGGPSRDATVANGLDALRDRIGDDDWVLVHDAARCGITSASIERLIACVCDHEVGGLLAVPLDDTVKREAPASGRGAPITVAQTVDRRGLWRAQTPQMFRYAMLRDALAAARSRGFAVTDEASAIEAAGHRALLIPGAATNFKVTTADDLAMMDLLLRDRPH